MEASKLGRVEVAGGSPISIIHMSAGFQEKVFILCLHII